MTFTDISARLVVTLLLVGTLGSCCPPKPALAAEAAAPPVGEAAEPAASKPPVTVVVIIDQLGSWVLERYLPQLPEQGAIRRALRHGVYVERAKFDYAITYTAPGHAAVHTGASPFASGIIANAVVDDEHGEHAMVSDGVHLVIGNPKATASPTMLRAETVADALERVTEGKAMTLSLAVKDRAAVIPGGQRPDLVIWYDKIAKGFTTSSYYRSTLPSWLVDWQRNHPTERLFGGWEAHDPALYARVAGPDDAPGEGDWAGLGTTFPHDVGASSQPYSVLRTTPMLTEQLLSMARVAIEQQGVGNDDVVDFVALSIAGTDYAGHIYGPLSWEYLDNLIRADLALAQLVDWMEQRFTVSLLVSSDHGATMVPEQSEGHGGRMMEDELERSMSEVLVADGLKPLRRFAAPYIYLAPEAREGEERGKALSLLRKRLEQEPGYFALFDARQASSWHDDADPLRRAVGRSIAEGIGGDFYLVCKPGWLVDDGRSTAYGSSHGSPWPPDRQVPVLFTGPTVEPARIAEVVEQKRVAATIAALLGIEPPEQVRGVPPLPGVEAAK